MQQSNTLKGFILAIFAAILWGVSGTFGQFLFQQRSINVEWLITVRMLIAGFILLLIGIVGKNRDLWTIWKSKKNAIQLLLFSITGMVAVQYTYFAAIKHSNAATATVLQYAGPVLIAIYLAFKYRRLPKPIEYLAIALAITGAFLLVTHGDINNLVISKLALFLGLASAVALAIYTLQPIQLLNKYSSMAVIGWAMFLGGLGFSFIKAPWAIEGTWDNYTYYYVIFIIIFGTLIPFYAYLTAVKLIGGQKASLLACAEPLSATVMAVVWLNVPFTLIDWIGSVCIISTVFLLSLKSK